MADILRGLKYLHDEGMVHGALRPSNVLINKDHEAILSDCALVKKVWLDSTGTTSVVDTRYQAPEVDDQAAMSPPGDVWSWAMTSVEVVSGGEFSCL